MPTRLSNQAPGTLEALERELGLAAANAREPAQAIPFGKRPPAPPPVLPVDKASDLAAGQFTGSIRVVVEQIEAERDKVIAQAHAIEREANSVAADAIRELHDAARFASEAMARAGTMAQAYAGVMQGITARAGEIVRKAAPSEAKTDG